MSMFCVYVCACLVCCVSEQSCKWERRTQSKVTHTITAHTYCTPHCTHKHGHRLAHTDKHVCMCTHIHTDTTCMCAHDTYAHKHWHVVHEPLHTVKHLRTHRCVYVHTHPYPLHMHKHTTHIHTSAGHYNVCCYFSLVIVHCIIACNFPISTLHSTYGCAHAPLAVQSPKGWVEMSCDTSS